MSQAAPSAAPSPEHDAAATQASASVSQSLEDRYGGRKKRRVDRRFAWISGSVLVVASVGFLVFSGWQNGNQVSAQDIVFTQTGDDSGTMKFQVSAPPNTPVACVVEALNTSKATVGWSVIELPISEKRTTTVEVSLRTTTPPTAAQAKQCWVIE